MSENKATLGEDTYIGTQKVLEYIQDEKTGIAMVTLENGRKEELTMDQMMAMISPAQYPDAEISVRKWKPAVDKIMDLFLDNNLKMMDKDFVLGQIESRIVKSANAATEKLWGGTNMMRVSLRQIDEVLKQNEKPTGSESQEATA